MLRLRPDNFTLAIFGAVVAASFLPVSGSAASALKTTANLAIALLFFMHGAKISRQAALAGLTHWRLHLLIIAATFLLFPLIGLAVAASGLPVPPEMMAGIVYMTLLPSTVQSSIAFSSIAKGNVAAAVCAASASNLLGIFLTPALVSLTLNGTGVSLGWDAVEAIALQLLFPAIGLVLAAARLPVPPEMMVGILYMTLLPSTVQSSIAFTSIAKGNVAAAVCAASASNLFGIFLTPALVSLTLNSSGISLGWDAVYGIAVQLLLPFIAGQILQPWIGGFITKHKAALTFFDRGSILLIVYLAFSEAVIGHLWQDVSVGTLALLIGLNAVVLALVLAVTTMASRAFGFSTPDEIAIVMCGSKKSLASGVPMANIIFAGQNLGMIVLPIMIFHQIQLMVCAVLAQRYAQRLEPGIAE